MIWVTKMKNKRANEILARLICVGLIGLATEACSGRSVRMAFADDNEYAAYEDPWDDIKSKGIFSRRVALASAPNDPEFTNPGTRVEDLPSTVQAMKGSYVEITDSAAFVSTLSGITKKTKLRLLPPGSES